MDMQSLYQRWYDENSIIPYYVSNPELLSYGCFVEDLLGDIDILYHYGYNPAVLTVDDLDDMDNFNPGIFTNAEMVYIFQQLLNDTTPA